MPNTPKEAIYNAIILHIFENHYRPGIESFEFERSEIQEAANKLELPPPKNLGDVIYSFRYRKQLPERIRSVAGPILEWVIEPAGQAVYRFRLTMPSRILPRADFACIKIPDSTPEIIVAYAMNDEQALLAKLRYNRIVDIFLGITGYSLQNHLRTTVKGIGQIEIDEVYVGVNRNGQQFIVPVQAKGGTDQLATIQTRQDIAFCKQKYPQLVCRPISAQFLAGGVIAVFELTMEGDEVKVVDERHYKLVPSDQITAVELMAYRNRSS